MIGVLCCALFEILNPPIHCCRPQDNDRYVRSAPKSPKNVGH